MRTIIKGSEGDKMENVLNYVRLRQDISFQMSPFNVIDALILSDLAYVDWNNIVKDEKVDLQRACRQYFKMHTPEEIQRKYVFSNNVPNLAKEVSRSNRFKDISLMKYREVFDEEKNIQFSVVTFVLPDETLFISYRGTDGSITGWKENMQMTYMSHLPCQKMAAEYAEEIIDGIEEKSFWFGFVHKKVYPKIYLAGHSKGGNLAMYAALFGKGIQEHITSVFAFDAPGFRLDVWNSIKDRSILEKITNYKPKDSIIGCLLEHQETAKIVDATDFGLTQHDAFSWSIGPKDFNYVQSLTKQSEEALAYIDKILMCKEDVDKKMYIDLIFSVIDKFDVKQLSDFNDIGIRKGISGILELRQLSGEEIKFLFEVISFLRSQTSSLLKQAKK